MSSVFMTKEDAMKLLDELENLVDAELDSAAPDADAIVLGYGLSIECI